MKRSIFKDLWAWKDSNYRKPLIVKGARQVGKTWLIKEFGKVAYQDFIYINFEKDQQLKQLFNQDFNTSRILLALKIHSGLEPKPGKTLIIFDEIQEIDGGLTSLKYFREDAPEYHIICAGSLLGIAMQKTKSFPVGKVDFLDLYPLNFEEFLMAKGEHDLLELLKNKDWGLIKTFKSQYIYLLKQYYFVGGMPEAVDYFQKENDFKGVRTVQSNILKSYEYDFSKYAPANIIPKIRMIWNGILAQLSKENKKFIYGLIKSGARAKDYEDALLWLENYGVINKVYSVNKVNFPLRSYTDTKTFKLFVHDVGLLNAMGQLDEKILLEENSLFNEFKGALTEQYVLQELIANHKITPYYWSENTSEIDFLFEHKNSIYPLEVKAKENLQSKSLKVFNQKHPEIKCLRTSLADYREEEWLCNFPLYALMSI